LEIAWVDDSPEALRRREMVRKKEAMEKGDEERETRMLEAQIKRAQDKKRLQDEEDRLNHKDQDEEAKPKKAQEGPLSFSLGSKPVSTTTDSTDAITEKAPSPASNPPTTNITPILEFKTGDLKPAEVAPPAAAPKLSLDLGSKPKRVNVFASTSKSKSNPLKEKKPAQVVEEPKRMSAAERIMREEMDRKRVRDERQSGGGKRARLG
jgi:DNA/RNA-binding protein KIN17